MKIRIAFLAAAMTLAGAGVGHTQCDDVGTLPQGTVLYHGTPVGMFTWQQPDLNPAPPFNHPSTPDGPAWFADDWQFSIHAGLRFLQGQSDTSLTLYQYSLRQQIATLTCPDLDSFTEATGISLENGDYPAAVAFCAAYPFQYNGYVIEQDAVREQPEVILCNPASVLTAPQQQTWFVTQVGREYTAGGGRDFSGNTWNCLLSNENLGIFICEQPQARQQSGGRTGR